MILPAELLGPVRGGEDDGHGAVLGVGVPDHVAVRGQLAQVQVCGDVENGCAERPAETAAAVLRADVDADLADLGRLTDIVVIALGTFGGMELGFASDLDLVFIFDDDTDAAPRYAKLCAASNLAAASSTSSPSNQ